MPALARISDPAWWLRGLRTKQWREMEHFIRAHGGVSTRRALYISDLSFFRRFHQKQRNAALLQRLEAENELGQTFTLAELAALSPSNPIIRRHELMTRMRGFEDLANERGDTGIFFTLTCPSKFHRALHSGKGNPRYNGSSPLDAQHWLNTVWQRVRAAWARVGITPYGMRTVEPHHDGTPHWHLMLFLHTAQVEQATALFEQYALAEDGDEPGAKKYRLKAVKIDPTKGSATGYIAKYIAKNIDGYNVGADQYGRDAIESAARIEAWASIWGIRQFAQIGGPSVTVWREARRLEPEAIEQALLQQVVRAADDSDWAQYTRLMGGPVCARKERPVRPMMLPKKEESRYGELTRKLQGLWFGALAVATRIHQWTVRLLPKQEHCGEPEAEAFGFGVSLSNAPPGGATLEFCQ